VLHASNGPPGFDLKRHRMGGEDGDVLSVLVNSTFGDDGLYTGVEFTLEAVLWTPNIFLHVMQFSKGKK